MDPPIHCPANLSEKVTWIWGLLAFEWPGADLDKISLGRIWQDLFLEQLRWDWPTWPKMTQDDSGRRNRKKGLLWMRLHRKLRETDSWTVLDALLVTTSLCVKRLPKLLMDWKIDCRIPIIYINILGGILCFYLVPKHSNSLRWFFKKVDILSSSPTLYIYIY